LGSSGHLRIKIGPTELLLSQLNIPTHTPRWLVGLFEFLRAPRPA
jgi:hypothetical protein